jgi:hypothetical protein
MSDRINKEGARYASACAKDIKELSDCIRIAMEQLLEDDGGVTGGCCTDAVKAVLGNLALIDYTTNFMIENEKDHHNEQQKNKTI